jgi:TolA-binding protein
LVTRNRALRGSVHDDGLAAALARAADLANREGRNLALGAGAVILVAIGIVIFRSNMSGSEKAASAGLAEAHAAFTQGQTEVAATTLAPVIQKYSGTKSGTNARLLMGDIELRRGNVAAAEEHFKAFIGKTSSSEYMWANAQRGRAVALENLSRFADAATAYEDILKAPVGDEEKAHALLDAARAKSLAGDSAGAWAHYERILSEFATTRAAAQAKVFKAEAEVAGGPKAQATP